MGVLLSLLGKPMISAQPNLGCPSLLLTPFRCPLALSAQGYASTVDMGTVPPAIPDSPAGVASGARASRGSHLLGNR